MPPHLHPRSQFTSSLFATTLFASFFVVSIPHILPCPAPRIAYADDGTRPCKQEWKNINDKKNETAIDIGSTALMSQSEKRACPIPKPGGIIGEILGFKLNEKTSTDQGGKK
ncbi:Bgt-4373 [Blumeria graminis f. sp. tritici]|uniref:Bgt-4373 n=3 Tax=Blumeria graminis TaxID=34373 RepID=A0A061HHR4_BLUGR|nr:hypothetical protein BGT96224_4373 [Blumeria graminis f. sp. tritici 96224]VDB92762.1 Bgt-4373 [Blumeria graminis f. sp. tritici]